MWIGSFIIVIHWLKRMPPIAFWLARVFWKGVFQSQAMGMALSTEQIHLLWMSHQLLRILNWKIKIYHQMLRQHADYFQNSFCLSKRKPTHWPFSDNTIRGSPIWQHPFTRLGEREQSGKFSWLQMLSPRERRVEYQPRGTFTLLKVLRSCEHCFPGNHTFINRASFRYETAVNC